jgi:hypothetical protein
MRRDLMGANNPGARGRHLRRRGGGASLIGAAAVLAVLSAAACGGGNGSAGSGKESPNVFVQRITTEFSRGQSGRLWDELAPADQAIVNRARYTACQGNEGFVIKSIKVLDTFSEPVEVDGSSEHSEAVTLQVTSDNGVTTATMHAISIGGKWHWILSSADRAAFRGGKCP